MLDEMMMEKKRFAIMQERQLHILLTRSLRLHHLRCLLRNQLAKFLIRVRGDCEGYLPAKDGGGVTAEICSLIGQHYDRGWYTALGKNLVDRLMHANVPFVSCKVRKLRGREAVLRRIRVHVIAWRVL